MHLRSVILSILGFFMLTDACSQGKKYTGPIIDMHLHAFDQQTGGLFFGREHPPTLRGKTYMGVASPEAQMTETFRMMEKHHVVKAMVAGGHLWYDEQPEKILIGRRGSEAQLRQWYAEGRLHALAELAPFYSGIQADDPSMDHFYKLAEELNLPVGLHLLPGGPNGGIYTVGMKAMRAYNAHPLQVEDVLVKYPGMKIYIMHGGWPYLEDMKALMYAHPQVYVDIAVINWILPVEEFHHFLKGLVNAGFGKRIMYGSDQMTWPQTIEIGIDAVNAATFLSLDQKEDIFYNNAARFLGLGKDEINNHKGQ